MKFRLIVALALTVIGGLGGFGIAKLDEHKFFVGWTKVEIPTDLLQSDEKIDKILGAGVAIFRVKTNRERAFEIDWPWNEFLQGKPKSFHWQAIPNEDREWSIAKFGCPYTFWPPPVFGKVVDYLSIKGCRLHVGIEQADYAVLEDGSVWVWGSFQYLANGIETPTITFVLGGVIIGLMLSLAFQTK